MIHGSKLETKIPYADFYDKAPDLFFSLDAKTGVVIECNQTACEALGYEKQEIVGSEIFRFYDVASQESARRTFDLFHQKGLVTDVELKLCRKDGSTLDVSLSASGVREGAEIVRSRSICRDITRLKQTEKALRQSEKEARERSAELAAILDALPAMLFIAHSRDCLTMTSSREAYKLLRLPVNSNVSKSAPEGHRPSNFIVMKNGREVAAEKLPVQQVAATGQEARDTELTLVFDDGAQLDIFGNAVPLVDQDGLVRGAVGAFIDVTRRNESERQLLKAKDELERRVEERTAQLSKALTDLEEEAEAHKKSEEKMREISGRLLHVQDEERRRIARDLHDAAGQTLSALKMTLRGLARRMTEQEVESAFLEEASAMADRALNEIRTTSYLLHPPMLDEIGFGSAARWFLDGLEKRSGIQITSEIDSARMPPAVELVLFRVLQESLTNIHRHSGSPTAEVSFKHTDGKAILTVRDHGKGLPAPLLDGFKEYGVAGGVGLAGMAERVREVGGKLRMDSALPGTAVIAEIPMRDAGES
jgi:PAS domain S-box-containing protein